MNLFPKSNGETDAREPGHLMFHLWELADQRVPFPYLYVLGAFPREGCTAATLHDLRKLEFIYRVTGEFVAQIAADDRMFGPALLRRESAGYRLMPIQGRQDLITPDKAERAVYHYLERQQRTFWEDFLIDAGLDFPATASGCVERFHELMWHSLRLEQPLRAGVIEPYYKFRKARSRYEFLVGARSGRVLHERDQN